MKYKLGKVYNLGSSSDGNAFVLEINRKGFPNPYRLLIECGFDYNKLSTKLVQHGLSLNEIDCVLITHEHQDHAKSVSDLLKRRKLVFAPKSVYERYGVLDNVTQRNIMENKVIKGIADGIEVLPMELDHENDDGSKTYNLGYIITVDKEFKILFVIDTKHIRWDLSEYQFNVIFIEANNLYRIISNALKNAQENKNKFQEIHFNRVLKSHMLAEKTAKTLATFDLSKTDFIYLTHLSSNTKVNPKEIKNVVREKLLEEGKFRRVKFINKDKIERIATRPLIIVANQYGELE